MVDLGDPPPSPRRFARLPLRPGPSSGVVSRQLFPENGAQVRCPAADAWRIVLGFLDARSEDGIRCALRVAEDGRLSVGPALNQLRAGTGPAIAPPAHRPRPALDQRMSKENRMQVEALVEAARAEVLATLRGASAKETAPAAPAAEAAAPR